MRGESLAWLRRGSYATARGTPCTYSRSAEHSHDESQRSWIALRRAAQGIHRWDQLGEWLTAPQPPRSKKRRYPLPSSRYRTLPDDPGVYHFVRSNGDVLYVGKAASLRKRVPSHFTAGSATTERALEMLTQVHDIQTTLTRTPLEAALLENERIKALSPPTTCSFSVAIRAPGSAQPTSTAHRAA